MIMCRCADMLDLLIEIEMTVKNNAKNFKMVSNWNDRASHVDIRHW